MSLQEVKDVLKYRLDRTTNVNDIYSLASTLLNRNEYDLLYDVCRYGHDQLLQLDEYRLKTQRRNMEINDMRKPPNKLTEEIKRFLELEEHLRSTLPEFLRLSVEKNHELRYQFTELMVKAALNNRNNVIVQLKLYNKTEIDDDFETRKVEKIIEDAMNYLHAPPQLLKLCRLLDNAQMPILALPVAEYAYKVSMEIKKKLRERTEINVKVKLLEQEQARLKRIKMELSKQQLTDLTVLREKLLHFQMPFSETMNAFDVNVLEQMSLQIALVMIACAVNFKKNLMEKKKLVIQKNDVFTKKERETLDKPEELEKLLNKVLDWALEGRVEDPSHMIQLAKSLTEPDLDFAFSICDIVRKRLKQLKDLSEQRIKQEKELERLKQERETQLTNWKLLSEKESRALYELELQKEVDVTMVPNYVNITKDKLEHLESLITKFILDCIYDRKDKFEDEIQNPLKFPNAPRRGAEQIATERTRFATLVANVIEKIEDPNMLYEIAQHVQKRKDGDSVVVIGEKAQKVINNVEALREVRAPLQTELDTLKATKEDLLKRKREFDKQDRIDELEKMISKLPPWPEYADLNNFHQYDSLSLDMVRVMTGAILDNKTALEQDIARMFRENAPETINHKKIEKDRNDIQEKIRQLTKQCLTKFTNPAYLLKFAKDMKARKETEIVLEVIQKCLQRVTELNAQRKVRKPIQLRIDELELANEEATKAGKSFSKKEKLLKLKTKISKLPLWPHFGQLYKDNQYDQTVFQAIEVSLLAVLEDRDAHEANLAKQFYEDRTSVDFKKITLERQQKEERVKKAMDWVGEYICEIEYLQNLIQSLANRKDTLLALQLTEQCLKQIKNIKKIRTEKNTLQFRIDILTEEEKFLQSRKKTLDEEAAKELTSLKKQQEKFEVPQFDLGNEAKHQILKGDLAVLLVNSALDKKNSLVAIMKRDKDMTEERKQYWTDYIHQTHQKLAELLFTYMKNPTVLLNLSKIFRAVNEFDFSLKIGDHCFNELSTIRVNRAKNEKEEQERKLLQQEEDTLNKVMQYLRLQKKQRLRELLLQERLLTDSPPYYQVSFDPNDFALTLTQHLIVVSIDSRNAPQIEFPMVVRSSNVISMDIDEDTQGPSAATPSSTTTMTTTQGGGSIATNHIVKVALDHIVKIPTFIGLAKFVKEKLEWGNVIVCGKKCQDRITEKKKEFQQYEDLNSEFERLDNLRLQLLLSKKENEKPSAATAAELEDLQGKLEITKKALEALPPIDMEKELDQLNQQLLEITELIIEAAKVENQEEELRLQTIMAFKANTTTQRWDQVRALTPEEDWAKVKEELVVYVLRQNTNIQDKIELLLKDGLYKQVIEVFPKPTGKKEERELLLLVYKTIEEKEPTLLEKMIPIVARYMKRYYQEQKYDKMDPLLDRFQRRFPGVVASLLSHACDMVMFDIMPSQYNAFVNMLRDMKHRLEALNRNDDWNDFFVAFKKKHFGKKKLMQMINLIGDSMWDLETIMSPEATPPPSSSSRKKRIKEEGEEPTTSQSSGSVKKDKRKSESASAAAEVAASATKTNSASKRKSKKKKKVPSKEEDSSEEPDTEEL